MWRRFLIHCFLLLCSCSLSGADTNTPCYVSYDQECRLIYNLIMDYRLDEARTKLQVYEQAHPENLATLHLANYIDFFQLFIEESMEKFTELKVRRGQRLTKVKNALAETDPYRRFLLAELHFQWGLARAKMGETIRGAHDVYTAYLLYEENHRLFPHFIYNYKGLSVMHALIETVQMPGVVKKLLRLDGSVAKAVFEIKQLRDHDNNGHFNFDRESDAIFAFIQFYQAGHRQQAMDMLKSSSLDPHTSLLSSYLFIQLYHDLGDNEKALAILNNRPKGNGYGDFDYLDYLHGLSYLYALDERCIPYFEKFLSAFKGQHYIKEAHQKLAWARYVLLEDTAGYKRSMALLLANGQDVLDGDQQAQYEAESGSLPDAILLKARLLHDGGYFKEGIVVLNDGNKNGQYDKVPEFTYRMGRLYQGLGDTDAALSYYEQILNNQDLHESYFRCNAILQTALLYESVGQNDLARNYLRLCLDCDPERYARGIHQKARTALLRLEGK